MTLLKRFTVPTRRAQLVIGFSILFYFVAFHTQFARSQLARWPYVSHIKGQNLPIQRPYDKWQPPYDWTGRRIIWDNFHNLNERFSSSVDNLVGSSGLLRPKSRPFPQYGQTHNSDSDGTITSNSDSFVHCKGPSGLRFNESDRDIVVKNVGTTRGYAEAPIGSSSLVGFEQGACYDRFGRHGIYGLRDVTQPGLNVYDRSQVSPEEGDLDWDTVDWAALQRKCFDDNQHRFDTSPRAPFTSPPRILHDEDLGKLRTTPRTAIVFRAHSEYQFTEEVRRNMRAVMTELALYTGGEYAVYLLMHVRDDNMKIWESDEEYERAIIAFVPPEFRSITVLWNQVSWKDEYPNIKDDYHNVHMSQWLPMQFFQRHYPEFDYYWNWEMDIRYTGHYLDFVRAVDNFTRSQPRKGMWERNERFYMPRVHGTYEQFRDHVQNRYNTNANGSKIPDSSIWGPHFPAGPVNVDQLRLLNQLDVRPPVASPDGDQFEWGVGESADFMTFLPMFNPYPTEYVYKGGFINYDGIPDEKVYRRTTIVTLSRLSGRLLRLMEAENKASASHHMSSETWPHSVALHYGLKAVYVPHGIYMEQDWPANALDFVFNNGDQSWTLKHHPHRDLMDPRGEGSGGPESAFGLGYENSWERTTWYYTNRLAERLYKRWMGWEQDNIGGAEWEKENGYYCLPPMLMHPIKSLFGPEEGITQ